MYKRLPDGSALLVRRIRPDDKRLLADGLRRLSLQSVQRRFLAPKPGFSQAELRYLTEVDGRDHVALVAVSPEAPDELIGVGRFVRHSDDPQAAEVAITVADCWQRRGVGSALAESLAAEAQARGISSFTATMLSDNLPAQRLMQKLTAHLDRRHGGHGISELVGDLAA